MLINLYIENYVLFDKQNLEFKEGFSTIFGDTGAGKSLIIDALSYLCGERLLHNISKDKNKSTFLEGHFIFSNPKTFKLLEDNGIEKSDIYIVSREIRVDNKSIARINNRSVTLGFIKDLFENEIDIHSQRDSQYLLNKKYHLNLLDSFSNNQDLLNEVEEKYHKLKTLENEIYELENSVFNEAEIEFLKSQIIQIENANVTQEEYNQLIERIKIINSFEKIYSNLLESKNKFNETSGIIDFLYESSESLDYLSEYEDYNDLYERVHSLYLEAVDIGSELSEKLSLLEFDENELNENEERLFNINSLIKRYGGSIESLFDKYSQMQATISKYEEKDLILNKLNKDLDIARSSYLNAAKKLSDSRKANIPKLEEAIILNLADLHMEDAKFNVSIKEKANSRDGFDEVEFLVSTNKGFALAPLIRVASGGELSRLMLGLKVIFSKLFGISLIIFDEIDTGVSGSIASSIGYKMAQLSNNLQVFSVTHLAQVVACSKHYYYVNKEESETIVSYIDDKELIEKLAVMAFGHISENSLNAAAELYNNSQNKIRDYFG